MTWEWLEESVVIAIHDAQLAEHGGIGGLRDGGLPRSALARPQNLLAYGDSPDVGDLAAADRLRPGAQPRLPLYGNKRTAFVAMEAFLDLNGAFLFFFSLSLSLSLSLCLCVLLPQRVYKNIQNTLFLYGLCFLGRAHPARGSQGRVNPTVV